MDEPAESLQKPRLRQNGPLLLAGLNQTYRFNQTVNLPAQWQRFASHHGLIPGQVTAVSYGLCHSMNTEGFQYLCGVEIAHGENLAEGLTCRALPLRHYAVFNHNDHVSIIRNTIDAIWRQWLPASKYSADQQAGFFYERYGETFDPVTGFGDIEIWIPIET